MFQESRLIYKTSLENRDGGSEVSDFWRNVPDDYGSCGIGFVAMRNASREAVEMAIRGLCAMKDRTGEAFKAGDGAGLIFEIESARALLESWLPPDTNVEERDVLSAGMFFFAPALGEDPKEQKAGIARTMKQHGIHVHGWRKVPMNEGVLPDSVRRDQPSCWQILYSPTPRMPKHIYNQQLFYAHQVIERVWGGDKGVYPVSLNGATMTYKAKATPGQFKELYPDLNDPNFIVRHIGWHARMGTNAAVTWENVQPFRVLFHNGELVSDAAQSSAQADYERRVGMTLEGENSVTVPRGGSDTRHFDGMVHTLMAHQVKTWEAMRRRMAMPRDEVEKLPKEEREWFETVWRTHGPMAAGQGPAAVIAITGNRVIAIMDPMGLRTLWLYGNKNMIIGSSEVGSPAMPLEDLEFVHRLNAADQVIVENGKLIMPVDTMRRVVRNSAIKMTGDSRLVDLNGRPFVSVLKDSPEKMNADRLMKLWNQAGGEQHVMKILKAMALEAKEPVEGMGDDRPLAILSGARLRFAEYATQVVGVVTDPPVDSLREGDAFDLRITLGKPPKQKDINNPNKFEAYPEFIADSPFLNPAQFEQLLQGDPGMNGGKPANLTIDTTFEGNDGADMEKRLDEIIEQAVVIAEEGKTPVLVFSDRACGSDENRKFVPAAMIASGVHQALRTKGLRDNVKLVFDTMDVLEGHDGAFIIGQGGDAVNPYLMWEMAMNDEFFAKDGDSLSGEQRLLNVQKSLTEILKEVMSKHGVISLNAYRGACLFELLGVDSRISKKYFPYNVSRISGLNFDDLVEDQVERLKEKKFRNVREATSRKGQVMAIINQILLQKDLTPEQAYEKLVAYLGSKERDPVFLRDLLGFVYANEREGACELQLDEVESVESIICRHFRASHMSDGALGPVAHSAIAAAVNEMALEYMPQLYDPSHELCGQDSPDIGYSKRLNPRPKSGSGEGGEDSSRFPGGEFEIAGSKAKQIASGRFGVDAYYLMSVGDDGELNIKIGQGAKPGQGGHVKGEKITPRVARQRGTQPGVELISPPTQHDIYSIEDLMRLIWDIRAVNPKIKTVSVKITTKAGVGTISVGVAKAGADKVILSGREGGTGAAKVSAIHHTGSPLELGVMEAFRTLQKSGMVDKITMEADGGIITGADVVKLAIMGVDEFGFGTSILQAGQGCIFCKKCFDGTAEDGCPVGITIQELEGLARLAWGAQAEKKLKAGEKPLEFIQQYQKCKEAIKTYWKLVAEDVQRTLAKLGVKSLEELRGRYDLLKRIEKNHKSDRVDLGFVWNDAVEPEDIPDFGDLLIAPKNPVNVINQQIIDKAMAHEGDGPCELEIDLPGVADPDAFDPEQSMRTIGGTLAGLIASKQVKVPAGGFSVKLKGYVGQSFGFCMVEGMRLELEGIGRDFIGSAMSGGKIVIKPPQHLQKRKAIPVAGASCAYGARGGKLFVAGEAGQRFGVRACLDATMVCEGVGKYAFEYMTGGMGVVLGNCGDKIGSGMGAGELFLWNEKGDVESKLSKSVKTVEMTAEDELKLRALLQEYFEDTKSPKARMILNNWKNKKSLFAKVVPKAKPKPPKSSAEGMKRMKAMGDFPLIRLEDHPSAEPEEEAS